MEKAEKTVLESIDEFYEQLFSAERKVADCIRKNPDQAIMMNVSELASASGASEATVVRMCKHIGYQGYYQMRLVLAGDMARSARTVSYTHLVHRLWKPGSVYPGEFYLPPGHFRFPVHRLPHWQPFPERLLR